LNVFITGASSGIGEALAREFANRFPGSRVGILARRESMLADLASSIGQAQCLQYPVDLQDSQALRNAAEHFLKEVGCPDIVIANAGISAGTETGNPDHATVFHKIQQINVNALHDTFAAFLPTMKDKGAGVLVGVGSVAGVRGMPGSAAYCASKAAANTYLESLRVELHDSPISVVTIAPGFIKTPMTDRNQYSMPFLMPVDEFAKKAADAILARRSFVVLPWQMAWVARLLRLMPNFIYDRLMSRSPRKSAGL
jgi:short-subunit dehydrogenase